MPLKIKHTIKHTFLKQDDMLNAYVHSISRSLNPYESSLVQSKNSIGFCLSSFDGLLYYNFLSLLTVENMEVLFWVFVAFYFVFNKLDLIRYHPCSCIFKKFMYIKNVRQISILNYLADNSVLLEHHCYIMYM